MKWNEIIRFVIEYGLVDVSLIFYGYLVKIDSLFFLRWLMKEFFFYM